MSLRFPLAILIALVLSPTVSAQYIGTSDEEYTYGSAASRSLTVGPASVDVSFNPVMGVRPEGGVMDATGIGVRLSGKLQSLTAVYATGDDDTEAVLTDFTFGPSITPFAKRDSIQFALRFPVRFGFGHTYLQPGSSPTESEGLMADPLHIGRVGFGLGVQVEGGAVTGGSLAQEVTGAVRFLAIPGIQAEFSTQPFEQVHAQRSTEVGVELRANGLGGSGLGLFLGYSLYRTGWRPEAVESFQDVIDAATSSDLENRRRIGLFHVGLSF